MQWFCWETLIAGIHMKVTLKCSTQLNFVVDQAQSPPWTALPEGNGLHQQDTCLHHHTAKTSQETLQELSNGLKLFS